MGRTFIALGALFGFVGVAAGAFGAHALRERLTPALLETFKTGAHYQLVHAVALLVVGVLLQRGPNTLLTWSGWLFVAGIVLFSGSLYGLALTGLRAFGPITPLGGLCFLAGWALLALGAWRGP